MQIQFAIRISLATIKLCGNPLNCGGEAHAAPPPPAWYMDLFQLAGTQVYFPKLSSKYTCVNIQRAHTQSACHPGKLLGSVWQKDSVTHSGFRVSSLKVCQCAAPWLAAPRWSCRVTARLNHLAHAASFSWERTTPALSSPTHEPFPDKQCKQRVPEPALICSTRALPALYVSSRRTRMVIRAAAL